MTGQTHTELANAHLIHLAQTIEEIHVIQMKRAVHTLFTDKSKRDASSPSFAMNMVILMKVVLKQKYTSSARIQL